MQASYLAHHGVKGMKWGVRKDRSARKTEKKAYNALAKGEISSRQAKNVQDKSIARGRVGTAAKFVLFGREAIGGVLSGGAALAEASAYIAAGGTYAQLGLGLAAIGSAGVGVGVGAGYLAYKSLKRFDNLNKAKEERTIARARRRPSR